MSLDIGNLYQTTQKRNPGRGAGKGPAPDTGNDNTKFATNDKGTGNLMDQPMGKQRSVSLPPVVDPSGSVK